MTTLCLYHKNCPDGLGAALAVREHLRRRGRLDSARFQTVQYGDPAPDVTGLEVYIVDFSFPRPALLDMAQQADRLLVIDHHKSAELELADLDYCIFDVSRSGAVLAWEHLLPGEPVPRLLYYLQDRDLWRWELPGSREVSAALRSYKPFFEVWEEFLKPGAVDSLKAEGAAILRYQQQELDRALSRPPGMVVIGGYTVPCINATHLISELGNELAKGHPFAALYFDTTDGKRVFSLRSTDEGVDVSEVAKRYGGGGHRNAAGFTMDRPPVIVGGVMELG